MTVNSVTKKCPQCGNSKSDIHAAIILTTKKGEKISYNKYTCLKCHIGFAVKRKGDKVEQTLTEKFIKSEKIILE
ncbi:hypothetical protein KAH94_06095 [bacterium]|nr:hypothetical protein [bacterium]